jgi:hypothetical protein
MVMTTHPTDVFPRRLQDLDIHLVDDGYVVYHQSANRVHYLNASAAVVLELCDGSRNEAQLSVDYLRWFEGGEANPDDAGTCLEQLRGEGLVV